MMITFDVPTPPRCLHPNARSHWRAKAAATSEYRATVRTIASQHRLATPADRATLQLHYWTRTAAEPDDDNLGCWWKAGRDGLADAGIITNDKRFTQLPPTWGKDAKAPRVVVTVEAI